MCALSRHLGRRATLTAAAAWDRRSDGYSSRENVVASMFNLARVDRATAVYTLWVGLCRTPVLTSLYSTMYILYLRDILDIPLRLHFFPVNEV